ncbi:hypothetical protein IKS73_06565, partial [bacterium]|nr:hypothetical protein [bacterium]
MKNILFAIFVAALVLPLQAGSYQWRYCYYSSCEQKASIKATLDSDMMKRLADTNNLLYIGYDEAYVPAVKQGGKGNKLSSKYKYSVNKSSFKCSVKYSAKNQKLVSKMSSKNDDDGLWIWVGNRDYYYDDYYYDNSYAIPTSFKVTSTGILKEPIEMSGENYRFDHEFETMEYPYGFQLALEGKNYVYNG